MEEELVKEYKKALKTVNKARMTATDEEDRKLLNSCADSVKYAIDYMELGKEPENRRAISRRSGVQREIPTDPESYTFIRASIMQRQPKSSLTKSQQQLLDDLLAMLTNKERDAFSLVRGSGYSFEAAAELMGVKRGSVQRFVMRAEEKFTHVIQKPPIGEKKICSVELKAPVQRVMFE